MSASWMVEQIVVSLYHVSGEKQRDYNSNFRLFNTRTTC